MPKLAEQPNWALGTEAGIAGAAGLGGGAWFAKSLASGFGHGSSAVALDGSAAALGDAGGAQVKFRERSSRQLPMPEARRTLFAVSRQGSDGSTKTLGSCF